MNIKFLPNLLTSYCYFIVLVGCIFLFIPQNVHAQDSYPREYTNPDEIIAFDRATTYQEAIEVINQFYQEYRNKFILDQTETAGQLGVSLPAMHWEDALDFILRIKNLSLIQHDEFVEIVPFVEEKKQTQTVQAPSEQVSLINLGTREVRINATFFEGNRTALQEVGVDWSTLTNDAPVNINEYVASGQTNELQVPQTDFTDQFVSVNSYGASSVSENVFNALVNLGEIGAGISVQALFSAFEADNLGEILATPFTKVMDGQEGRVQVGQDFSIKQRDIAGNVTDQFFSTGTILTVTPTVIEINDTSFIHLAIEVERSSAQPNEVSTIISKESAQTQALLLDGEATTIAGLYRTTETKVRRGVPILKDLPGWFFGLKYLFGYNSSDYSETELIIIVQASLEDPLTERASRRYKTNREILETAKSNNRMHMDAVFENEYLNRRNPTVTSENTMGEEEVNTTPIVPVQNELVAASDSTELQEADQTQENEENQLSDQSSEVTDNQDTVTEQPEELTNDQLQLANELSMPIDNPELMVVVPRAFSLDEYLNSGVEKEVEPTNQKYFVVGGSFIVKNNANRFDQSLKNQGYDTRVLFHPSSRFNFVAYQGFTRFDEAVDYLNYIRSEINSESWLFILPDKN